jgi:hypothetical protein
MKFSFYSVGTLILSLALLTSCSNDNDDSATPANNEVPNTYTFTRNGSTTVDFSGQTARI